MADLSLIVNAGSATVKYAFFDGEKKVLEVLYEREGEIAFFVTMGKKRRVKVTRAVYDESLPDLMGRPEVRRLTRGREVMSMGFRVVHGGQLFRKPVKVTKKVLDRLATLDDLAPLHNPFARRLVEQAEQLFAKVTKVLVFDTGFHATLPEVNWRYALPHGLADRYGLRRYGFHGIACASVVRQLSVTRRLPRRLVICHLGSGCSVTAILDGKSVDTSMGMTPLEGLVMGTRAGDVDAGLLLYLQGTLGMSAVRVEEMLEHESGLKGLTGTSDMREALKRFKSKDKKAKIALDIFCSKVAKYVAAFVTSLGGLDMIVFSGGIGEHSAEIREKVCEYLRPLGVRLDMRKNRTRDHGFRLSRLTSKMKVVWMKVEEEREILEEMRRM